MRHDDDVFVSRTWKRSNDARGFESFAHFAVHLEIHAHRPALTQHFADALAVFVADVEAGTSAGSLPEREVVGDPVDHAHGRRAVVEGTLQRAVPKNRVVQYARRQKILDQHGLALDLAPGEVGRRTEAGPN